MMTRADNGNAVQNHLGLRKNSTNIGRYLKGKRDSQSSDVRLPRINTTYERVPIDKPVREKQMNTSGFGGSNFVSSKLEKGYAQQEAIYQQLSATPKVATDLSRARNGALRMQRTMVNRNLNLSLAYNTLALEEVLPENFAKNPKINMSIRYDKQGSPLQRTVLGDKISFNELRKQRELERLDNLKNKYERRRSST